MSRRAAGLVLAGVGAAAGLLSGCGGLRGRSLGDCREDARVTGDARLMPVCVDTVRGAMEIEREYLPGVLACEVGGFRKTPAALEAQAIVARTYLLAHLTRQGPEAVVRLDGTFQCWKAPSADADAVRAAVRATDDLVLHTGGDVLDANYAAGSNKREADCRPKPPEAAGYDTYATWAEMRAAWVAARKAGKRLRFDGVGWTELLVTDNEGRTGLAVEPTPFAPKRPTNRGAFGQWAAACLAGKRGYAAPDIVRFFFGADVEFSQPVAPPIAPPG
jgi:hypothetical protein